jgi:beta-N-acetylhexosaminidase
VPHIEEVAATIEKAVATGRLDAMRLNAAAAAVFRLADYRPV